MSTFERMTDEFISNYFSPYGKSTRNDAEALIKEKLDEKLAGIPVYIYGNLSGAISRKAQEVGDKESKRFFAEVDSHEEYQLESTAQVREDQPDESYPWKQRKNCRKYTSPLYRSGKN